MTDFQLDPNVCPSSLNEDGEPMTEGETAHKWDMDADPVACAECGAHADLCECGNVPPTDPADTYGDPSHAPDCPTRCDGFACAYGCGTCFCPCHDGNKTGMPSCSACDNTEATTYRDGQPVCDECDHN